MNKPILLDETGKELVSELHNISLALGGEISKPTTFEEVRVLCRNGNIDGLLEVGDTIPFTKDGVRYNAIVVDFIKDGQHSDGLRLRHGLKNGVIFQTEKILYNLQFDEREAFYCAEDGLSAGTYHFKLGEHSWVSSDVNKSFQFTLTKAVPVGGQLVFKQTYNATLVGGGIDTFSDGNSRTAIETVTMSEGTGGTDLGTLNNGINGKFNSCQRALLGSNRWSTSAIRQQLNSDKAAGSVWTPQTKWDRPPSWVESTKGFLNGCNDDLVNNVTKIDRSTYLNVVSDCTSTEASNGTGKDDTVDKIFLASRKEVFMPGESNSDTTEPFAWYSENSVSSTPHYNADDIRIKIQQYNGQPYYWWLQSPNVGGASTVRRVYPTGANDSHRAGYSLGVAPAFVIA